MNMARLFTDWEIRIVALGLAVMVYLFTGNVIEVDQTHTIRIGSQHIVGLSEDYQVQAVSPSEVVVELRGPRNVMEQFDPSELLPRIDFSTRDIQPGDHVFDITARLLQLPPELGLRHSSDGRVRVEIGRMVRVAVPVSVQLEDFSFARVQGVVRTFDLDRTNIEVFGPEDVIARIEQQGGIRIEPTVLNTGEQTALSEARELRGVPLRLDLPDGVTSEVSAVTATILVLPKPEERQLSLPLQVLASYEFLSRYRVELHQPEVALTLIGPAQRVRALDPATDLIAYIDLAGEPSLDVPHSRTVRVLAPPWLSVGPAQARITIRLRSSDSNPQALQLPTGVDRRLPDVALPD